MWGFLRNLNIDLPQDPAFPRQGIYPANWNRQIESAICNPTLTAPHFTMGKMWNRSRRPSSDGWINTMWAAHATEYYQPQKIMKPFLLWQNWCSWTRFASWNTPIATREALCFLLYELVAILFSLQLLFQLVGPRVVSNQCLWSQLAVASLLDGAVVLRRTCLKWNREFRAVDWRI